MTTLRAAARIEEYARRRELARAAHPDIEPRLWALAFKAGYDAGWDACVADARDGEQGRQADLEEVR